MCIASVYTKSCIGRGRFFFGTDEHLGGNGNYNLMSESAAGSLFVQYFCVHVNRAVTKYV